VGTGNPGGFVDEFNTSGEFIKRIATGGPLYAPWGVTIAPADFGSFSNDLLIGNFGNGEILAYTPVTDAFLGTLNSRDSRRGSGNSSPLAIFHALHSEYPKPAKLLFNRVDEWPGCSTPRTDLNCGCPQALLSLFDITNREGLKCESSWLDSRELPNANGSNGRGLATPRRRVE
jgi:hypothetical protein